MTKIGGIAKSKRDGDIVIAHGRFAQIPYRKLRSQLAEQAPKRNPFLRKLPTQSSLADRQPGRYGGQGRLSADVLQQQRSDPSGDACELRHLRD